MAVSYWFIFSATLCLCLSFPFGTRSAPAAPAPLPAASNSSNADVTINPPSVPVQPNSGTTVSPETFERITSNMAGGVDTIRDAIIGLVAFLIGGAKFAVDKGVQNVADVAQRVENKTIAVKNNVRNAGGALANTWGNALRKTGAITGQLVGGTLHTDPQNNQQ
ncbi:hypothetical protein RvY_14342 [Ramazzottius varieornatus]|uniref:Salivary secreted peptide n=1 Tax=Ramazzottius varieornatus TaxID=947166 RepID=A0A1D1VYA0_RAMVA|nr:hypothetical protein RvY_14342 [Ramazzottius varieornatus]